MERGVFAWLILYVPLQVELFDEFEITLKEYWPEKLNLMVPTIVEKPREKGDQVHGRDRLGVQVPQVLE